jgi:signal recognition particle subunit SRP19
MECFNVFRFWLQNHSREYEPRGRVLVQNADDAGKSDLLQAVAAHLGIIRGD